MFGRFPGWVVLVAALAAISGSYLLLTSDNVLESGQNAVPQKEMLRTPERSPEEVTTAYKADLVRIETKIQQQGLTCAEKKAEVQAIFKEVHVPKQVLDAHIAAFFVIEKMDPATESTLCTQTLEEAIKKVQAAL